MESSFLTRNQALSLYSGSTDSRTLDYQRTNPREYQIVRTHQRKPLEYKIQHQPTTSSTLCRMPHLNNKHKCKPNHQQTGLQLTRPCPPEEKQTNKRKLSTNITLYEAYRNHWTNLRRAEAKKKKEFNFLQGKNSTCLEAWEKETSNTIN